jgi:hypothetical protein
VITNAAPSQPAAVWRWTLEPPEIPADLILRLQKYRNPACAPPMIRAAAVAAAADARHLTAPRAVVWRGAVALGQDRAVTLGERHTFHTRLLARLLADSTEAYVVVLTLGEALEQHVDALFRDRFGLEGLLLETAGWAAIEILIRGLRHRLRDEMSAPGTTVTHRLAPGYGDWPVDDQATLPRVFGDVPLPVCVNESACLFPRKSISAVFGVVRAR